LVEEVRPGVPLQSSHKIGTLISVRRQRKTSGQVEANRESTSKGPDSVSSPSAEDRVDHRIPVVPEGLVPSKGEIVHVADTQSLGQIKLREPPLQPVVVGILKTGAAAQPAQPIMRNGRIVDGFACGVGHQELQTTGEAFLGT
jgi:hypothetical protein